ncbi:HEAT repeat domain-containing protein [Archangium sp.]|uniref:HEAT repeat domain-containing protein n=1 Tax=Archangium sp. TaxID=1872627 RepID=UPI00286A7D07|nr:HEAT repeat domain-containing protein [Archangium sp.]
MAQELGKEQWRSELIDAFRLGDEEQARGLVATLREAQPRQVRAVLEEMLESPDGRARQAAAFALGELGGPASTSRLEQQLVLEEARGDHDGSSVAQFITQVLGQLKSASARAALVRKLKRLASGTPDPSDVDDVTHALWRKRHPELIPTVREVLQRIALPTARALHALLRLLESSPEQLSAWIKDRAVPLSDKTEILTVLDAEVPAELEGLLPAFISLAQSVSEVASTQNGSENEFCERLLTLLLLHRERLFPSLRPEARSALRDMARKLVAAPEAIRSIGAAVTLEYVGQREDAQLLETYRPQDDVLGKVFDDAARTLRTRATP